MKPATIRQRFLAALFAAVVGAALLLSPGAPASAAGPAGEPTRTAGFSPAAATSFQVERGVDAAGVQATITCQLRVDDPHPSTHAPGMINVVAAITCSAPVASITLGVNLYRQGVSGPIRVGSPKTVTATNRIRVNTATACVTGTYVGWALGIIVPPPGFSPSYGVVYGQGRPAAITC